MAGNSFGTLFRYTTWGESHGPAIGCVVDGVPPLLPLAEADIQHWVDRRRPGQSQVHHPAARARSGEDPLGRVRRQDHRRADRADDRECRPALASDYCAIKDQFRPGHADYAYQAKYGIRDYRGGGRASARETAMRVAAGAVARRVLART